MSRELDKARALLETTGSTCVLCDGDNIITTCERGVKPLLGWLEEKRTLTDFSAADKVVGKAAAMLYALLGVKEVYANVMTDTAAEVLKKYGISPSYSVLTDKIINRAGDGICPMEKATETAQTPDEALIAIKDALKKLNSQS